MAREQKSIENERDRKQTAAQRYQTEWQNLRFSESEKKGELKDKEAWQQSIKEKRREIEALAAEMKVDRIFSSATAILDIVGILSGTGCEDLREHSTHSSP